MSTETKELIEICEQLPEVKRIEVADFARFLLAQQADERWEQIIADPKSRPKLNEFLKASKAEGSSGQSGSTNSIEPLGSEIVT